MITLMQPLATGIFRIQRLLPVFFCFVVVSCSADKGPVFLEDRADILTKEERQQIIEYHQVLLRELDIEFKLIILAELSEDINQAAAESFGNLGEHTGAAKGLLFLVDPFGDQVRIEVGYDLEGIFPDIFVGYIENKQMVPFFKAGRVGQGVSAATELFVNRLQQAIAGKDFDPDREIADLEYFSGGGGARATVAIGAGKLMKQSADAPNDFGAQESPKAVLASYKELLRTHEKNPDLGLYTPESRTFFSQWVVTDAQQEHELANLLISEPERIIISDNRAVIRYSARERTRSPYFLVQGDSGWMLDFWSMTNVIRMNHKNMWHFTDFNHPYMFAFSDWQFDKNGFPRIPR